jgi:hypothetical protein
VAGAGAGSSFASSTLSRRTLGDSGQRSASIASRRKRARSARSSSVRVGLGISAEIWERAASATTLDLVRFRPPRSGSGLTPNGVAPRKITPNGARQTLRC